MSPRHPQEDFRRRQEFDVGNFGRYTNALELPFLSAALSFKCQQILMVEVFLDFVEVWLQGNSPLETQVIRFRACFFGQSAEVALRVESPEIHAADTACVWIIHRR